jgi:preprotein translocase subunit SecE
MLRYFREVFSELRHITWPTPKEVISLTGMVIGVSTFMAVFLGGLDFLLSKALEYILTK